MTEQLDTQSEAHEALRSAVADFGQRVLSDPRMLRSRMSDLLPDLPRERELLVTAAEADVAGALSRHVREQRLDPDTAVQLVAGALSESKSIDPSASMWVASEYAQALGYPVRSDVPVPPTGPAPVPQETVTTYGQYGSPYQHTAPPQDPAIGAPGGYGGYYSQPQVPVEGQLPTGVPPLQPSPWAPPARPRKRRNLVPALAAGGTVLVVLLYFVVAAAVHLAPFSPSPKPTHNPAPPVTHRPTHPATPPRPSLAPGVAPLTELLPGDVDDPATQCKAGPTNQWVNPGLVQALRCTDPGLPDGTVFAYQMDSFADYQAAWANFNSWWPFDTSSAQSSCPPSGTSAHGTVSWWTNNHDFPERQGQVLECQMVATTSSNAPAYAWTFPTEDTFIIAEGAPGMTFSALDSWWTNNVTPLNSPSPAAP